MVALRDRYEWIDGLAYWKKEAQTWKWHVWAELNGKVRIIKKKISLLR